MLRRQFAYPFAHPPSLQITRKYMFLRMRLLMLLSAVVNFVVIDTFFNTIIPPHRESICRHFTQSSNEVKAQASSSSMSRSTSVVSTASDESIPDMIIASNSDGLQDIPNDNKQHVANKEYEDNF